MEELRLPDEAEEQSNTLPQPLFRMQHRLGQTAATAVVRTAVNESSKESCLSVGLDSRHRFREGLRARVAVQPPAPPLMSRRVWQSPGLPRRLLPTQKRPNLPPPPNEQL
jgi:hypothetical protein